MTMEMSLLVPLVLSASLLGTVVVNEATHGTVAEMMGSGHHHLVGHDHPHCDHVSQPHHHDPGQDDDHVHQGPHHGPDCHEGNRAEG